jgi:hypothetical protein
MTKTPEGVEKLSDLDEALRQQSRADDHLAEDVQHERSPEGGEKLSDLDEALRQQSRADDHFAEDVQHERSEADGESESSFPASDPPANY